MRTSLIRSLLPVMLLIPTFISASATPVLDSLLRVYDTEVSRSHVYLEQRLAVIDSLRRRSTGRPEDILRIGKEWQSLQSDSARSCWFSLFDAPEPYRTEARIRFIHLCSSAGLYYDGVMTAREIKNVPTALRYTWFDAMNRLYNGTALQTTLKPLQREFATLAENYRDSLLLELERLAPVSTLDRLELEYRRARLDGDDNAALLINDSILTYFAGNWHECAIHAYRRANIYETLGDNDKRKEWLVRSAIADVRGGVTDNGSSWLVAQDCFENGDLERAYRYIDYSLTNVAYLNAPLRYIQTHTMGHIISSAREEKQRTDWRHMAVALVLVFAALFALICIVIWTFHQNRKLQALNNEVTRINGMLKETNRSLEDANHVKEQYICRYLEVYSDYIRRLTTMARKAGEKDPATFMNREMDNFYRSFDDTFLSLYGTFVQDFNALLRPEARITPKPGERMTIEMRIFALILLGIDSSAKIAELLCYSPNTISNYRVKVKNNALGNRDLFESQVRKIGV